MHFELSFNLFIDPLTIDLSAIFKQFSPFSCAIFPFPQLEWLFVVAFASWLNFMLQLTSCMKSTTHKQTNTQGTNAGDRLSAAGVAPAADVAAAAAARPPECLMHTLMES